MIEATEIVVPEKLRPLVPKFLERTGAAIEQLRGALAANDLETLRAVGHRLRGTAGGYGFKRLGELAGQLEDAVRADDRSRLAGLVAAIGEHFATATIRYA